MLTIFKKGSLLGDHRDHPEAIAIVLCDDIYTSKFINQMTTEKLLDLQKKSKRWKYAIDIEWLI